MKSHMAVKKHQTQESLIFHWKFITFQIHERVDVDDKEVTYRSQKASDARIIDFPLEIHYFLKFTNDLTKTTRKSRMAVKGPQTQESLIFQWKLITL